MKLFEIKSLLSNMGKNKVTMDKFKFSYNEVQFEVLIFTDRTPFQLLFGVLEKNFSFILELKQGYQLSNLSDEDFFTLCRILNLKPGKGSFTSHKFLKHFSTCIPLEYSGKKIQPHEVAWYKAKYVPESEKIYFYGWKTYGPDSPHSAKNFEKTKEFLGESVYQFCKKNNISSRWTNEPGKRKDYYSPNLYLKK
ncbi:hypothetical protein KM914_15175 [Virgibacillus pantothenticus]|uniref:DUF6037 family protein n=1 Tax=Virgibacillus pantothenticus TaxID=1473 RepID=UPI00067CC4F6|nr:DUF6037 family protein [Virgibacillus pantothenticus]MBU8567746.1 hypothetical protein [Virgibacillus pantothenticus]MBU8601541.1 hypothetical protein [Virgibacillus pantothenticus]MBU8635770.1 hypothetical protein [Virgibacillus pantothenticus]MBU8643474.1 hypothetical protein [Virgibacillus pantothenticus]MBU8647656.1 hypothetical protein [Virgibacillus pantothenticus]